MTSSKVPPPDSMTALTFSRTCRVCARMSPRPTNSACLSNGPMVPVNTRFPAFVPAEYGAPGLGAILGEEMIDLDIACLLRHVRSTADSHGGRSLAAKHR